jgi:hypothetical protein
VTVSISLNRDHAPAHARANLEDAMIQLLFKRLMVLAATTSLLFGFVGTASADPGKGLRWSDLAWGTSPRGQSMRSVPSYSYPSSSVPASGTIAVRGPDGVVRNYPVEGGASVQRQTGLPAQTQTVTVRDTDEVLRTYPVAPSPTTSSSTQSDLSHRCR